MQNSFSQEREGVEWIVRPDLQCSSALNLSTFFTVSLKVVQHFLSDGHQVILILTPHTASPLAACIL